MHTIYVWCDGTWCETDELEQMTHMSDDYAEVHVPDGADADDVVHAYITNAVKAFGHVLDGLIGRL